MQALLIHKTISYDKFKNDIYKTLDQRIEDYNITHYPSDKQYPSDHLVFYGFFTEEIARVLNINLKLKDCKSFKDYKMYFLFPNDAFKYRQRGEYKVEKCDKLVEYIYKEHMNFSVFVYIILARRLYVISFLIFFVKLYIVGYVGLPFLVISLLGLYLINLLSVLFAFYTFSLFLTWFTYVRFFYLVLCVAATLIFNPLIFIPLMAIDFIWTFVLRQINPSRARLYFNDLKIKRRYTGFFKQYLKAFRKVRLNNFEN